MTNLQAASPKSTGKGSKNTETTPSISKHLAVCLESASWFDPLRILGKTYRVEILPDHADDGEFGSCNYAYQLIQYNAKLAVDERKDTILHEMVHCLDHALQTKLSEEQVHSLSSGFYAILKDNSDFFRWVIADQQKVLDA